MITLAEVQPNHERPLSLVSLLLLSQATRARKAEFVAKAFLDKAQSTLPLLTGKLSASFTEASLFVTAVRSGVN